MALISQISSGQLTKRAADELSQENDENQAEYVRLRS